MPIISSADYIELEQFLFDKGFYNGQILNTVLKAPLTPVVEILVKKRNGTITPEEAASQINALKNIDARNDLNKYFYRTSIIQQNSINVSGSTSHINYFMSAGWDKSLSNLKDQSTNRITLNSKNTFRIAQNLSADIGFNYAQTSSEAGNNPGFLVNSGAGRNLYPYADLVDDNGKPLVLVKNFRNIYTDTAGGGNILNWKYRPLEDIDKTENQSKGRDYLLTAGIRYTINNHFAFDLKYQYENSVVTSSTLNKEESFFTRNLVNSFYQPGGANPFPIPIGAILDQSNSEIISHQGRAQLNYNQTFKGKHIVTSFAGWEIKDLTTHSSSNRVYGYSLSGSTVIPNIDYVTKFTQFNNQFATAGIPASQDINKTVDRFLSYYANSMYTYDERFVVTASARNDAANLFGVKTNQKGVPLWAVGGGWNISKEKFYKMRSWLPNLNLRATYGYNGNFSRATSAFTTIELNTAFTNPIPSARVVNPPNENLRWERQRIFNVGIDFALKKNRIAGSFEYYWKSIKDLMGIAPADPTLGVYLGSSPNQFFGNLASMKGNGFEIDLKTINIDSKNFKWLTSLTVSRATSRVTEYLLPISTNSSVYLSENSITPIIGYPIYSVFSYQWAGLDANGNPQGVINRSPTTDYNSIINNTLLDSLVFNGPVQPE